MITVKKKVKKKGIEGFFVCLFLLFLLLFFTCSWPFLVVSKEWKVKECGEINYLGFENCCCSTKLEELRAMVKL